MYTDYSQGQGSPSCEVLLPACKQINSHEQGIDPPFYKGDGIGTQFALQRHSTPGCTEHSGHLGPTETYLKTFNDGQYDGDPDSPCEGLFPWSVVMELRGLVYV